MDEPSKPKVKKAVPDWTMSLFRASASAVGLGGLLYCLGFLAIRSHLSLWGFWSDASNESADMVAEGGLFLYHFALTIIGLLEPIKSIEKDGVSVSFYIILISGVSLWITPIESFRKYILRRVCLQKIVPLLFPFLSALVTFVLGIRLQDKFRFVMDQSSLLTNSKEISDCKLIEFFSNPSDTYFQLFQQWIVFGVVFSIAVWALQLSRNIFARSLVWISGLLLIAATSLLPAVYGRLVHMPNYPLIDFSNDHEKIAERVLIQSSDSQWIVWNISLHKTEVIGHRENEIVTIGLRKSLKETYFRGGGAVTNIRTIWIKWSFVLLMTISPMISSAEVNESLLQRLFRLIHGDEKYEGRLSDIVVAATQKSGYPDSLTHVLFVNTNTGETIEWDKGRGTIEPVICPDGQTIFVRRGSQVEQVVLGIVDDKILLPSSNTHLINIDVRQIFGCTGMTGGSVSKNVQLWVEAKNGNFKTAALENNKANKLTDFPEAFRNNPPLEIGLSLRILQRIRGDGLVAIIRDKKLVLEQRETIKVIPINMPVTGEPAWVGNSDWIVVTGLGD